MVNHVRLYEGNGAAKRAAKRAQFSRIEAPPIRYTKLDYAKPIPKKHKDKKHYRSTQGVAPIMHNAWLYHV